MVPDLSPQPALNDKLRALLMMAVTWLQDHPGFSAVRAVLLLGSGAVGEATGVDLARYPVRIGDSSKPVLSSGWMPLSDLDVALICNKTTEYADLYQLTTQLDQVLATESTRLGLNHNPVEIGILPLTSLKRSLLSLELCEAVREPVVLAGDTGVFSELDAAQVHPFELVRLVMNRVVETLAVGGEAGVVPAEASRNSPEASRSEWTGAYRACKLGLDFGKVILAARGELEPSFRARGERLRASFDREQFPGAVKIGEMLTSLTRWREAPSWPPPEFPATTHVSLANETLATVCRALDITLEQLNGIKPAGVWQRVLALEKGSPRERLRAWLYLARSRPHQMSLTLTVLQTYGWALRSWPASLARLSMLLLWCQAVAESGEDKDPENNWLRISGRGAEQFAGRLPGLPAKNQDTSADDYYQWPKSWEKTPGLNHALDFLNWTKRAGL